MDTWKYPIRIGIQWIQLLLELRLLPLLGIIPLTHLTIFAEQDLSKFRFPGKSYFRFDTFESFGFNSSSLFSKVENIS